MFLLGLGGESQNPKSKPWFVCATSEMKTSHTLAFYIVLKKERVANKMAYGGAWGVRKLKPLKPYTPKKVFLFIFLVRSQTK